MLAHRIGPLEALGLRPLVPGLRDCLRAVTGDAHTPPTRWDLSSLAIFRPALGPATWAGWRRADRRVPVMNYVNRVPADPAEGYDVRVTFARDWRGGRTTYNSHNGTDLVVPVGTEVVAPAPGRVVRVQNLMNRGGLKVVLDHGEGLSTIAGHLSRAFVQPGQVVRRGARLGLSGFSSVDGILTFPWVPPHVHFTVVLDGAPSDPFAADGETSLWRRRNDPAPATPGPEEPPPADAFDADAVARSAAACRDPRVAADLAAQRSLDARAHAVIFWRIHHPTAFDVSPPLYVDTHPRAPRLDLPFGPDEVRGLAP